MKDGKRDQKREITKLGKKIKKNKEKKVKAGEIHMKEGKRKGQKEK